MYTSMLIKIAVFGIYNAPISAYSLPNTASSDVWLPRELGRFHLKDAGFVEVYETTPDIANGNATSYAEQYNLYITTFNAGIIRRYAFMFGFITNYNEAYSIIFLQSYKNTFSCSVHP